MKIRFGLGGVTFDLWGHFRTQMCYSCQKSCVKIWFEIGGMLSLRGEEDSLLGGGYM